MDLDTWASLPPELLLEIFSRLDAAAALSCTGVCKPCRRTIIGNAALCLRPLLGFIHNHRAIGRRHVCLVSPSDSVQGAAIDLAPYVEVLPSRDGLVLLCAKAAAQDRLCLRNLMTGDCTFLPAGEFEACTYVLITGYDLEDSPETALILVVEEKHIAGGMTYQIFSTSDRAWGAVTFSPRFKKAPVTLTRIYLGSEVVCRGGTVHWLAMAWEIGVLNGAVSLDVHTRRTWWTDLLEGCEKLDYYCSLSTRPARLVTSADGRLSLVRSFGGCIVEVWVLVGGGDDQWALCRTISVKSLLPKRCRGEAVWFSVFCPRSGCLVGHVDGKEKGVKELLIDAESGSCSLIGTSHGVTDTNHGERWHSYSYEMDWSTYLAKMKHF